MTAEGRARLKNFFGTRLQRRILLDHDHQRMEEERQKAIRTKSVDPTTRALEIEQEHEREAAAEQKLQQLRVPVAKMPVCRYIVVDASGQLHIRKTASVPENIRRCLAATKLLQKVCRGWRGRQKARRVLEFNERQEVFRAQMQNLLASAELARKALADAEQSAQDKDDDFNNIPDEVSMQPHVFAQVLETHFGYLHLTITELLYLTAAFLQSDGTVSCTAFVRHILGIIDSISGERRNVGGRYVFGPFPLVADLTAAPSSRHGLVSRKHKVPRAGEESMFYAQADDTGAHAYARILRVALQDPLQKFRYTPCRTSVQIPVNFRGVRELRRSSKLPSFSPQVSWIYGHSASSDHASRMVISKRNTVVYPGGKIVVLVDNVIRPSQSTVDVPLIDDSGWRMLKNTPLILSNVFIRPLPNDPGSVLKYPLFVENLVFIAFLLLSLFNRRKLTSEEKSWVIFLLFSAILLVLIIGWTTPVLGAIARYKMVPYLLLFIAGTINLKQLRNRNHAKHSSN